MPMKLVKKNPRSKVIRELSCEQEMAVKAVCGLKKQQLRHYMPWPMIFSGKCVSMMHGYSVLQCDCIPGDSPTMNFAALKNNTGTFYLSSLDIDNYCTNKGSQHQPTDQTPLLIQ